VEVEGERWVGGAGEEGKRNRRGGIGGGGVVEEKSCWGERGRSEKGEGGEKGGGEGGRRIRGIVVGRRRRA